MRACLRAFRGDGLDAPLFDLVLLGLGTNGHTASLFPGEAVLTERVAWAGGGDPARRADADHADVAAAGELPECGHFWLRGPDKPERGCGGACGGYAASRLDVSAGRIVALVDGHGGGGVGFRRPLRSGLKIRFVLLRLNQ